MKYAILILIIFFGFSISVNAKCKQLDPANENIRTRWGGNIFNNQIEEKVYKSIKGEVKGELGEPLEKVLVEVYTNPKWLLDKNYSQRGKNQKRVAVCETSENGKFSFKNLSKGTYELRISKNTDRNPIHMLIKVDPKDRRAVKKRIEFLLTLGV